jgi:GDP-D-mannose dehydratase
MRRGYQLAGWKRRAETAERKLWQLSQDIHDAECRTDLHQAVAGARVKIEEAIKAIEAEQQKG